MMVKKKSGLAELAYAFGVATEYVDQQSVRQTVKSKTVRAVLASLGVDASTPQSCADAVRTLERRHWESVLPPILVCRQSESPADDVFSTWVHSLAHSTIRLRVDLEDGSQRFDSARATGEPMEHDLGDELINEFQYLLPRGIPLGWHSVVVEIDGASHSCPLVVTPNRLELPTELAQRKAWGVATQLYSARSSRSWGIGDLSDLSDMASWFGRTLGADYILVNPLHASSPSEPMEASPYLPVTRRYANPIYLRVEEIEEFAYLDADQRATVDGLSAPLHAANHTSDLLDRDSSWRAKSQVLELVYRVSRTPGRAARFEAFLDEEGEGLIAFATWCSIAERYGPDWSQWPEELQDPHSYAVSQLSLKSADRIGFYCWLQWALDEQMADAARIARESGMQIGVMHDLAVGVHQFGADTWTEGDVMARHVTVGAPPDAFNQMGQDWSQPPRRPDQLAATGYASYRDMLRTLLRHSGGLRIDHVLGLFRLWWIPDGKPASMGTYVRYDHHAMVDILVLEAHRAGALIVGEDLGTVEPWVRDFLTERGILGTTILWFERKKGEPKKPEQWRRNSMASVTVHDLPPTLGYLEGDHVELRSALDLLTRSVDAEREAHELELSKWKAMLIDRAFSSPDSGPEQIVVGLHRLLASAPSRLLAVALTDLVGERETQNQPGTNKEHPNWRMPLCDASGNPVLVENLPYLATLMPIVAAVGGTTQSRA